MNIWIDSCTDGQWFRVCTAFPENRSSVPRVGSVQPPPGLQPRMDIRTQRHTYTSFKNQILKNNRDGRERASTCARESEPSLETIYGSTYLYF